MKIDLTGKVFGRLAVVSEDPVKSLSGKTRWNCRCECGNLTVVITASLNNGSTKSCGCLQKEVASSNSPKTHGMFGSQEYNSWQSMKSRCTNENNQDYPDYGGRGITVCDEWMNSFEAFYRDMGPKPGPGYSLDRGEVNGNYNKDNCRWATPTEQSNNKRNNVRYEYQGEQLTIPEISRRTDINKWTLEKRVREMNLTIEQAVEYDSGKVNRESITFNGMTKSLKEWSEYLGIPYSKLHARLYSYNWSIEKAFSKI
jgi:hypothetical protein